MEATVGDLKSTFVLLTHPSCRNSNVHYRSYKGLAGNDAENKMVKDALPGAGIV